MKVGLMLPFGEDEATQRVPSWAHLRDLAVTAEETGLDSIYGADHLIFHGDRTEGIREGWTALTAVAAVTSRVEVGDGEHVGLRRLMVCCGAEVWRATINADDQIVTEELGGEPALNRLVRRAVRAL